MRVVFLQDVPNVAQAGDVKEVKNGYARNYLLPRNLAVLATQDQLQRIQNLKKAAEARRLKEAEDWNAVAQALDGTSITIRVRAGAGGRLYGSVTNITIAEELSKVADREIDRRGVHLEEPIRDLGSFEVPVRLHAGVEATITVVVEAEGA